MGLFDTWNWDVAYGDRSMRHGPLGAVKQASNSAQVKLTDKGAFKTEDNSRIKGGQGSSSASIQDLSSKQIYLAGTQGAEKYGITDNSNKALTTNKSVSNSKSKSDSKSGSSDVSFTEGMNITTTKKKGFYQDDEKNLQGLRDSSAATQAANATIGMLTGGRRPGMQDTAAEYLKERGAIVDKYNTQLAGNDISSYNTAANIQLGEQYQQSTNESINTNTSEGFDNSTVLSGALKGGSKLSNNGQPLTVEETRKYAQMFSNEKGVSFQPELGGIGLGFDNPEAAVRIYETYKKHNDPIVRQIANDAKATYDAAKQGQK